MKNMIVSSMVLAVILVFTGCSCSAKDSKKDQTANPTPHAILIIDEIAYVDGCGDCDCIEEDVCICEEKADCECCRKHLKKAPKEMQEKCKKMKKDHAKQTDNCKTCKKECKDTACNTPDKDKDKDQVKDQAAK